jgi:hypothetical protein
MPLRPTIDERGHDGDRHRPSRIGLAQAASFFVQCAPLFCGRRRTLQMQPNTLVHADRSAERARLDLKLAVSFLGSSSLDTEKNNVIRFLPLI